MKKRLRKNAAAAALACALFAASAVLLVADVDDEYSDWSASVNLGPVINTGAGELGPTMSRDGLSLYFQSNRSGGLGGYDIYVSQRPNVDASWGAPTNLGSNINTPFNEANPTLSIDGHRLYFHSDSPGGFGGTDIYVSRRHNKRDDFGWQPAENLGSGVNTAAGESQACVFEDDATGAITLYFMSDRPGGLGGVDIYASTLQPDETFGTPVLVVELSSPFDDRGPGIRRDGLEITFPSNRPGSLGSLGLDDLWVSTRPSTSDPWSVPVNLGPLVNSELQDTQPEYSFDGTALYFTSTRLPKFGNFDLWVTTRTKLKGED